MEQAKKLDKIYQLVRFNRAIASFKILKDEPKAERIEARRRRFIDFYGLSGDDIEKAKEFRRSHAKS